MIRINLLPVRAAKRKETMRLQLTIAGLVTALVVVVCIGAFITLSTSVSGREDDIQTAEKDLEALQKKVGELSEVKKQKRVVQSKLDVVKKLDTARGGPVRLFKQISHALPENAWIEVFKDTGGSVDLQGFANTKSIVAEFMRKLQKYAEFKTVELSIVQRIEPGTGSDDMELVSFSIRIERVSKGAEDNG